MTTRVILGKSGASGAGLGLPVARQLLALGAEVDLVASPAAERTLAAECGPTAWGDMQATPTRCHDIGNIVATLPRGRFPLRG